ncbi:MinD/ParA family ATP-binding protein [Streptomyces melanogenes]|uniref:MinD/ParA family ATP-binding protein n=1 Tax=Streptomyces melanogenes TaxID=67326 RepID=UPI00167EA538|nr:hypothetical protein [Streptomyces melanogenes]GGP86277.1 hypothetical protein GCM10010278_75820 [Streptomyces melanogenes]
MRRLVVVGSLTGAPGVTTTALALAAAWPTEADGGTRPIVVEADGSGGDLMIRAGLLTAPSVLDVAAAVAMPYPGALADAASELPFGVRVVAGVPGRGPCRKAVRTLATENGRRMLLGEAGERGTVVLDVGRLTEDVEPLLDAADQVVLVTRGGAEPLMHVTVHGADDGLPSDRSTLAVIGPCSYRADDIAETVGIERVVFLPWDPGSVAAMSGPRLGTLRATGFRTPALMTAARRLSRSLARARTHHRAASARVPVPGWM